MRRCATLRNQLASILFISLSLSVQAQTHQEISLSGIILSSAPVEFADCYLKNNEHIGGLTNASGYFHLRLPTSMVYDTLVILAMGFERKEVPLASINFHQDTVYFYVNQQAIVLDEVLIESSGLNLKDIVVKAVANVPRNYPNKRHHLEGLYRKVSTKGTQFTHLEEAVIVVEDDDYRRPTASVKMMTKYYRQSKDWGDIDSSYITMSNKIGQAISGELRKPTNPLNKLYESNGIRHYHDQDAWFNVEAFRKIVDDRYTFRLVNISVDGGDTLYHVAFAANPVPPAPNRVSGRNYLIINLRDLAIVEMQFTLGFDDQPLMNQNHVTFQQKEGRYYPKYIRSITHRHINRNIDDDEYDIRSFWFDDVKLAGFQRIKSSEANNPADHLSHQRPSYIATFWDTTSLIQKHPLDESVKKDLEQHEPLEAQFRSRREE